MAVESSAFKIKRIGDIVRYNSYPVVQSPALTPIGGGSHTFDCSMASVFSKTGGVGTFTFTNLSEGQVVNIAVSSTGSPYTITWAASGLTFKWNSASVPTPTVTASRHDLYSFIRVGSNIFSTVALNMG